MSDRTCSIDGCDRPLRARGWCSTHYQRWQSNTPLEERSPAVGKTRSPCPDCGSKERTASGRCPCRVRAYAKVYRQANKERLAELRRAYLRSATDPCAVPDCGKYRTPGCAGFCNAHYIKNRVHGTPTYEQRRNRADECGYRSAHRRINTDRGKASTHECADCGGQAAHWSYNHTDPDELTSTAKQTFGATYSLDSSHYSPRCAPCHALFDRAHVSA